MRVVVAMYVAKSAQRGGPKVRVGLGNLVEQKRDARLGIATQTADQPGGFSPGLRVGRVFELLDEWLD